MGFTSLRELEPPQIFIFSYFFNFGAVLGLLDISESHLTVERAHRILTTPAVSRDKLMRRPNRKSTNQLYSYRVEA